MKPRVLVVGIIVVLTMLACQPQFLSRPADQAPGTGETGPTGNIQMKITAISDPLAKALGVIPQRTGPSSKTFLMITKVDLRLLLGGLPTAYEKTVSVTYSPGMGGEPIQWPMVPAAEGYQVEAWVYNENTDSEEPLLHGISEAFNVVSGTDTEVAVRPIPISPIAVPLAPSSVQTTLYSCWDTGEVGEGFAIDPGPDGISGTADDIMYYPPIYGWAEERWFEIDATGYNAIRVNAEASANSGVFFLIADQMGRSRIMALSGAMDNGPAYWNYGGIASAGILTPAPEDTYYVGLLTISNVVGSSVLSTVGVSFEPFSDDAYEQNDSISTAYQVSKTMVYDGIDLDPAQWGYPPTGGDWYKFELTALDDPNVSVAIAFDHDEADLALELYRWVGPNPEQIGQSDVSEVSGPGTPVLETELIEATLVPGIYYIWVRGNNTIGSDYQLQWVAGTGTIIIGIE